MLEAFPNMKIRNTKSTVEIEEFLVNLKKDAASLFVFFFLIGHLKFLAAILDIPVAMFGFQASFPN